MMTTDQLDDYMKDYEINHGKFSDTPEIPIYASQDEVTNE
jgi:hypothetical protein